MITGAASGLGALLASRLGELGARLVLGDRNEEGLRQVAGALKDEGVEVHGALCDVAKEEHVKELVQAAVRHWGRLDIGVNNAGVAPPMRAFVDTLESDLDVSLNVNVKGTFFGMKHQISAMLAQEEGGIILNVASAAGLNGAPKLAAYSAAKHAVVGLTKTAAVEYAKRGIRVNAICPFYTATPMVTSGHVAELQSFLANATPMKRLGRPGEVVETMLMLCSPMNSYLTGQAVAVDGGMSAL